MATTPNKNSESIQKSPSLSEAVGSIIDKKKQQKTGAEAPDLKAAMESTQRETAELMAGVEKPSEKISERSGESGEKGDLKTTGGQAVQSDTATIIGGLGELSLPPEQVMVRKIRIAIQKEINHEWKKAKALEKKLDEGGASEYNASIARIRHLKDVLASLFEATADFIKGVYFKLFTPQGKRKPADEL